MEAGGSSLDLACEFHAIFLPAEALIHAAWPGDVWQRLVGKLKGPYLPSRYKPPTSTSHA
jgi:hypothetical protein